MNEIIAYSPSDIFVEFGQGPFKVSVPLRSLVFERFGDDVNGSFVTGSEFLDSTQDNVFDKAAIEKTRFDIRSIRRGEKKVADTLENVWIFGSVTTITSVGGICFKTYYFTNTALLGRVIKPPADNSPTVINNHVQVEIPKPKMSKDDIDRIKSMIEFEILRSIGDGRI
jgi:hypothetical protein